MNYVVDAFVVVLDTVVDYYSILNYKLVQFKSPNYVVEHYIRHLHSSRNPTNDLQ